MVSAKEKLIKLLRDNKIIPFIGAGFAYASAGIPGWVDLIKSGLKYARDRNIDTNGYIEKAELELHKNNLLEASNYLKKLLNAPGFPFVNWMNEIFENVKLSSADLLNSILDLDQKILLTTNYDTLLSSFDTISNREKFIHSEYEFALKSIRAGKDVIIHLHGIYEKPGSIILSKEDYSLLNKNLGYKAFLNKLFSDYHILFIGCSKDGVMDEDFLIVFDFIKEWFLNSSNQHFILLHESEITSKNHIKLLTECNIEAITYGNDYSLLSPFINSINPNYANRKQKLDEYKKNLEIEFSRVSSITDGVATNKNSLDLFISENLNFKYDWIDVERMKIFEQLLTDYNNLIVAKKDKLIFTQTIIQSLFNVSELKDKVDLWIKHGDTPEKLNPINYITTAIIAYNCLLKIPKEIIHDFQFSNSNPIHSYFYDGYLGTFINEIEQHRKHTVDLERVYGNDKYLFENLKRIIESLRRFLEFDPSDLYEEIDNAIIVKKLPGTFVVVVTSNCLTVRNKLNLSEIYALLPLEKNLTVFKIQVLKKRDKIYIVGANSKYCFYWRPEEDLLAQIFYSVNNNISISDVFCHVNERFNIIAHVKSGNRIIEFIDFSELKNQRLDDKFYQLLPFRDGFIGLKYADSMHKGGLLYKIDVNLKSTAILTIAELAREIERDENVSLLINEKGIANVWANLIDGVRIQKVKCYDKELFLIRANLNVIHKTSLFVLIEIEDCQLKFLNFLLLKGALSISADCFCHGNAIDVFCGYLNVYQKEDVFECFKIENYEYKSSEVFQIKKESHRIRDIFEIIYVGDNLVILNEEGERLILYSLPHKSFTEYDFLENKKVICICYYDSSE